MEDSMEERFDITEDEVAARQGCNGTSVLYGKN